MKDGQRARGQKPAGGGKKDAVRNRRRRAAGLAPKDGQLVPEHDDLQLLPLG
jgi:hypothetical protein